MVALAYNPSTWEAKAGQSYNLRHCLKTGEKKKKEDISGCYGYPSTYRKFTCHT
jgi:hypothetical protein